MISFLKSSPLLRGRPCATVSLLFSITGSFPATSFPLRKAWKRSSFSLCASARFFGGLFEENPHQNVDNSSSFHGQESSSQSSSSKFSSLEKDAVAVFKVNADYLEKSKTVTDQKAFGIPFQITDMEEVLRRVRRHHGTNKVKVHSIERLVMPFWLTRTAAGGSFKAELLQKDPAYMTQPHCYVWVEGPQYDFQYPFDEYLPMNQTCACYTEPLPLVESCVCGSHIPSMLVSRFELLQELESMTKREEKEQETLEGKKSKDREDQVFSERKRIPLKILPFVMSTTTALNIVEKRVTRQVVMDKITKELRKFHGRFLKSNVSLNSVFFRSTTIRPTFLPLYKLIVTSQFTATPVPVYVCGATGKTVGPVLHATLRERALYAVITGVGIFTSTMYALWAPWNVALTISLAGSGAVFLFSQYFKVLCYEQKWETWMQELKKASILNLPSDTTGYRWTPEQEERQEYEYREHLRQEARKKASFQERIKEESRREYARKFENHIDPKRRRRTDLKNIDPLGYYAILGLRGQETTATAKDVAKAFRQAVRVHHPDVRLGQRVGGDENASGTPPMSEEHNPQTHEEKRTIEEEKDAETAEAQKAKAYIQKLIEAYKVLHNDETRKAYDSGQLDRSTADSSSAT